MVRKPRLVISFVVSLAILLILGAFALGDGTQASVSDDVYSPDSTQTSVSDQVYSPYEGYIEIDWQPTPNAYWLSTSALGAQLVTPENSTATNHKYFIASKLFSREDLPIGSIIEVDSGYQYRPDGWITIEPPLATSSRPGNVTTEQVVVDEAWWGMYQYRGFNIAVAGGTTDITKNWQNVASHFRIYVPLDRDNNDGKKAFKLLAIGNSFSEDAFTYLQSMAKADGVDIKVGILYIGGSALSQHWTNASENRTAYTYIEYINGEKQSAAGATIDGILKSDDWDYVSMQQASHFSGIPSTYDPYLQNLEDYVKTRVPQAEILIHQTWAYEQGSSHYGFIRFEGDPDVMFNQVSEAYRLAAKKLGNVQVIPSGLAMQKARSNKLFDPSKGGKSLFRDGYHANLIHGRYLLAAVWYEALTGNSIFENTFKLDSISAEELAVLKQEAHQAVVDYTSEPADLDLQNDLNGFLWYEGEDYYAQRPPNDEPVANLASGEKFDIQVDDLKLFGNGKYEVGLLAAGSRTTYDIELNGKPIGRLNRAASGFAMNNVTMTFLNDREVALQKGDVISIIAPEEDGKQVIVDEEWWGDYQYRGFNIAIEGANEDIGDIWEDVASHFRIYVPTDNENNAGDNNDYIEIDWEPTPKAYWQSTSAVGAELITSASNSKYFVASKLFTRKDLPMGSIIEIDPGYQYRPDGWISIDPPQAGPTRPGNVTSGADGVGWVDAVVLKNISLEDPEPTEPEEPGGPQKITNPEPGQSITLEKTTVLLEIGGKEVRIKLPEEAKKLIFNSLEEENGKLTLNISIEGSTKPVTLTLPLPSGLSKSLAGAFHYNVADDLWEFRQLEEDLSAKTITFSTNLSEVAVAEAVYVPEFIKDAVSIGRNSVTLSWTAAANNTSYTVYQLQQGEWKPVAKDIKDTQKTISGLSPSTDYSFKVKAFETRSASTYESDFSDEIKVTTTSRSGGGGGSGGGSTDNSKKEDPKKEVVEEEPTEQADETEESTTVKLSDIAGHWAEANIQALVNLGAINGYPNGTFLPSNNMTRAEFATVLVKAFGLEATEGKVFADTANHWAKDAIATAAAHGLVSGYNETVFGANDNMTREQMAVMIVRAINLQAHNGEANFADSANISPWALEAISAAVYAEIITGYPDNTFRPHGHATRAEAVTVILRALAQ